MARNILKARGRALVRRDLDRRGLIVRFKDTALNYGIAENVTMNLTHLDIDLCLEALKAMDEAL